MSAIKCGQCGHENDVTRVFCQNCGTRLDRPEGSEAVITGPTESPVKGQPLKQRKTKKTRSGEQIQFLPWLLRRVVASAFLGFILAVIIQIGRKPDGVPAPQPPNELQARKTYEMVRTFSESPYSRSYDLTQDQINNYLATHIVAETVAAASPIRAEFQRAFVVIDSSRVRFFVQQKHLRWPIYFYLDITPAATGGGEGAFTGGGIGSLPLNGPLLFLPKKFVAPILTELAKNMEPVNKAGSVTLSPPFVKLSWSGQKKTP